LVIPSEDNDETMTVENTPRKILIKLPNSQFQLYDKIKYQDIFINVFFSIIAIPSLSSALERLKESRESVETLEVNYKWFETIAQKYKDINNTELDDEQFYNLDVLEFSQLVLNHATATAIQDVYDIVSNLNTSEEDANDENE